jgi:hypothetical protein
VDPVGFHPPIREFKKKKSNYMIWNMFVCVFPNSFYEKFEVDASHYFKCPSIKIAYKINTVDKKSAGRNGEKEVNN